MARHNEIGTNGESIAVNWVVSRGMNVIERNYRKKYGEIDIVARETIENGPKIHFIEVKSVSYETKTMLEHAVSHETWRPEENVHAKKQKRLKNVVSTWLNEHMYGGKWQIDIITVRMVPTMRYAVVHLFENVVFE